MSLHPPSHRVDTALGSIIDTIVDELAPRRVILFGSRARGDARADSDYDIVVEADYDDTDAYWRRAYHAARRAARRANCGYSISMAVRRPGEIERKRFDPGFLDWDVAREGIVVYPRGANSDALRPWNDPRRGKVRETGKIPESVADWLARADEDLKSIDSLIMVESPPWGSLAFHAQQAAEKYLKAVVIRRGGRPLRTHDLSAVAAQARALTVALPDLEHEYALLEDYGVDVRYPDDVPIPRESQGRELVAAGRRIVDATRPHLL